MAAPADPIYRAIATALDTVFYRTVYEDVARSGVDPVRHYVDEGWREGRDPAPWFSTSAYLARNPDVAGANPFHHYLTWGWREGREAEASNLGADYLWRGGAVGGPRAWRYDPDFAPTPDAVAAAPPAQARARMAEVFDVAFYHAANPDIAEAGVDALDHFLQSGWREGRDPSRDFSVADYLELNPDVAATGVNPFQHYVLAGRVEGRPARHNLGFRHRLISRLTPLADRQAAAARASGAVARGALSDLVAGMDAARGGGLHITFSHDDYSANVGGLQLCLQREAQALAARGIDHLHLFPVTPWPTVRPDDSPAPVGVLWNEANLGAYAAADIVAALRRRRAEGAGGAGSFALHNLLGHAIGEVLSILDAAELGRGYLWLHDFTSLCAGVHLMRDDVADCGAPPPASPACTICVYGPRRALHMEAHDRLFAALDLTIVAPSQSAYDTWRGATPAPAALPHLIHPHARLIPAVSPPPAGPGNGPLRVAFLGMPSAHKGWPAFVALAERFADDPRYEFMHLGSTAAPGAPVAFHRVSVSAGSPLAMRQAMQARGVDVAVLWSLCRETFSFTAYEAVAVGAAVLTGPDSGNIAAFAAEGGHGRVLADEAELAALFESGEALALARAVRCAPTYDLAFSALTVDLLEAA
jgi:hypothetical protein